MDLLFSAPPHSAAEAVATRPQPPAIVRVDVTFYIPSPSPPPARGGGRGPTMTRVESSMDEGGGNQEGTLPLPQKVWYCNEVEVHPSLYFHLPVIEPRGGGSSRPLPPRGVCLSVPSRLPLLVALPHVSCGCFKKKEGVLTTLTCLFIWLCLCGMSHLAQNKFLPPVAGG